MKKVPLLLMLLCAASLLAAPVTKKTARKEKTVAPRDYANTLATLQTDMGDITVKFFYDKAPHHVQNFVLDLPRQSVFGLRRGRLRHGCRRQDRGGSARRE